MRLWHYKFISVLPRQQLIAQWRECICIMKNIQDKGSPNHILVNKIMDYNLNEFYSYVLMIKDEMNNRGYNISNKSIEKCNQFYNKYCNKEFEFITEPFNEWHSSRYLTICYYNLYEKYLCGGVNKYEWEKFTDMYIDLAWKGNI